MSLRRVAVPLVLTAMLLWGAGPAPASAAELALVDASGDMWAAGDDGTAVASPGSTLGDVTRARVSYRGSTVELRLRFVDLARRGSYAQYAFVLQGRRDLRTREVVLETSPRHWSGRVRVFKPHGDLVTSCPVAHDIDYAANTVRVRVSRDCLDRPGSVRANVNVHRADELGTFYSDNPHDGLDHSEAWTSWVRRTA